MIKKLRRKFVLIAVASVAVVLAVIVGGINLANYRSVCDSADDRLDALAEAGGTLAPMREDLPGQVPAGPGAGPAWADPDGDSDDLDDLDWEDLDLDDMEVGGMGHQYARPEDSPEFAFETRYFTASYDSAGNVAAVDVASIAAVDAKTAAAIAQQVADNAHRGWYGDYRYLLTEVSGTHMALFVDSSREVESARAFALASVVASLAGLAAVAALLVPLSALAVRPVAESQERQRRFVTDASHELKTPLAIISSAVDVMEIESGESEWTHSVRNQVGRLADLTAKLVSLAKADEGATAMNVTDFDLTATADTVIADFRPEAVASGKRLVANVAPGLTCHADQTLVRQALSLLLDNALKHSAEESDIVVSVTGADGVRQGRGRARVSTTNAIEPGTLAPGAHPELFDRFTRADEARSSSGGHGIGLAVVRAIAEAHDGDVTAQVSPDGTSITISLRV
ncbi:MAG: HAMP domain-containing histidine kinase [Atopobiaceae bacterium]|nr:HAMP domain-containing histidine kinase [Atopobiaceae bacterium]